MKYTLILLATLLPWLSSAEIVAHKKIDDGGTGPYKAIVASESELPDYVIYRPINVQQAAKAAGQLPLIVFANGACSDSSLEYERMLTEIASHGYLIMTLGPIQHVAHDRPMKQSTNEQMPRAIDWMTAQNKRTDSDYFNAVELAHIAYAGHSCGGAQLLDMAAEPRVSTYMMFNSGIGDMTMARADRSSLLKLHAPVVYLVGGESDVAYKNALLDYERIAHVPVALANAINGGHSGTFAEPNGGSFARMALHWLNWQLKGQQADSAVFLQADLREFPGWTMQSKQF